MQVQVSPDQTDDQAGWKSLLGSRRSEGRVRQAVNRRGLYKVETEAIVDFRWEGASFNSKSCTRNEVERTQVERVKGVRV